jgi:two-component system response regulator DesR
MSRVSPGFRPELALAIAHHDDATRQALIAAVSAAGAEITVIGIAAEGATAHALVRRTAPDVALIEADLPGIDGLAVARALAHELPACRVILLGDDSRAGAGLDTGAAGWLDRSCADVEIVRAVRGAARRESVPHATWANAVLAAADAGDGRSSDDRTGSETPARRARPIELDPLDRTILEGLARGDGIDTVSHDLGLTRHLVGRRLNEALHNARVGGEG